MTPMGNELAKPTQLDAAAPAVASDSKRALRLARRCRCMVQGASLLVIAVGMLVLVGWYLDLAPLKSLLPGAATMKPNTALSFVLLGASLWLFQASVDRAHRVLWCRISQICAALVALITGLTLAEYLFGIDAHIDTLLFPAAAPDPHASHHGRMAPATAAAFVFISVALLLLQHNTRWRQGLAQITAFAGALIGLVAILGYLFGIEELYRFYSLASVALHTAFLLVVLGVGVMLARTEYGFSAIIVSVDSGGFLARRVLPAAVLAPFLIGWLRLQGEYAGYYGTSLGTAILTTANVAFFIGLLWLSARSLNRKDAEQRRVQEDLQLSQQRLRDIIDGLGPYMFVGLMTPDGVLIEANRPALDAAGLKPQDVLGKSFENTYWWSYAEPIQRQLRDAIVRAARGEAARYDVQIRVADNQFAIIDFSIQPLRDHQQQVVFLIPSAIIITERKQAEDQLHERERRLATLISNLPGAVFRVRNDPNYTAEYVSDQIAGLTGYPAEDFRQNRRNFGDLMHPDDRDWVWSETQQALDEHRPYEVSYRFIDAHGQVKWNTEKGRGVYDENGELQAVEGFVQDVTAQNHAETALRESEERLRLALDAAHMGIFDWDISNNHITWSRWHEELWGLKPGEFGGTYEAFAERVHPHDLQAIEAEIAHCMAQHKPYQGEFRVVWPDGSVRWISGRGEFTYGLDNQPLRMRGTVVEITERKQAEESLRASQQTLHLTLDAAHIGYWDLDLVTHAATRSLMHDQIFGYSTPTEWSYEIFLTHVRPEDKAHVDKLFKEGVETKTLWDFECRIIRPDGEIRWIWGHGNVFTNAAGEAVRMLGMVSDISPRKEAQAALLEAKQSLENKVLERTAELQAIQRELHVKNEELVEQNRRTEEANRLKTEFLANMSHELRTPLNAIIGFSELMYDGKVGLIADNHKEYLGDVLTSAQHLLQLINDVLDLAKVESGKLTFHYDTVDLNKVIREICDVLATMVTRTRTQISVEVEPELRTVQADASKLKQVLYNYLSNALKFSPEGRLVQIRVLREGPHAYRLEVEDQGIGIRDEDIPRLFTEFQQLDISPSKK